MAEYNFNSLVQEIAKQKIELSKKFIKKEKNETPKEVFNNVCETIAKYYENLGFKWYKSQTKIQLKKGEFTFIINFNSSRYNRADEYVEITVGASVYSSKLKKWEKESPYRMFNKNPNGSLGGGQIGNLQENNTWLQWNVAIPENRELEIKNIIENINKLAFPFFDKFSNLEKLKTTLINEGEHYHIHRTKLLLYFFKKEDLEKSLNRFLTKRELWNKYYQILKLLKENKEINHKDIGTYWYNIAQQTIELNLTLNKN